jgi:biopolymer transport protein ExbD
MKVRRAKQSASIPLTSTADVAFLLLIFFLVLARGTNEAAVDWKPARTEITLEEAQNNFVSVIIDKDHKVYINGNPIHPDQVKFAVEQYWAGGVQERKVLLKVDKDVPEKVFAKVMLDIGSTGADLFRILEPGQPEAPQK